MAEYIDRDAFVMETQRRVCAFCNKRKGMKNGKYRVIYDIGDAPCRACGVDDMISEVEDFPAADVQPVKHGRWVLDNPEQVLMHCSNCNWLNLSWKWKYCPNCGARMDGET